jgi:hypothetical protein
MWRILRRSHVVILSQIRQVYHLKDKDVFKGEKGMEGIKDRSNGGEG